MSNIYKNYYKHNQVLGNFMQVPDSQLELFYKPTFNLLKNNIYKHIKVYDKDSKILEIGSSNSIFAINYDLEIIYG